VVGRRQNGYHLLDSLAVFVDLADELAFAPAVDFRLRIDGPFASALGAGDNLIDQAARLLLAAAPAGGIGCARPGAAIALTKNIPVAAGLGGGSADAAAALEGLDALWRLGLDAVTLDALAPRLGADVAVCRFGRPALMSGIGEILAPAPPLPSFALLLLNPNRAVATADVFRRLSPPYATPLPLREAPGSVAALADALRQRGNDLAAPAIALCPQIGDALDLLAGLDRCRLAQMSGSGATCFGLFDDLDQAQQAQRQAVALRPHWFARACAV
jgi:4-diphosphocytidyl-2-C-methyl-D-erythritol kinase